jgi:hypothetical protein
MSCDQTKKRLPIPTAGIRLPALRAVPLVDLVEIAENFVGPFFAQYKGDKLACLALISLACADQPTSLTAQPAGLIGQPFSLIDQLDSNAQENHAQCHASL